MRHFPHRPARYVAPQGCVVSEQAHVLGLPDVGALTSLERWRNDPASALAHHVERGDLGEVLVLHLIRGASPREVGQLAARWCDRIPALDRWPAVRRLVALAQHRDPDTDILYELARTMLAQAGDSSGVPWSVTAIAHAALLVVRTSRVGAGESAWRCGRALEQVLRHQLGALHARDVLVELGRQAA